MVSPFALLVLLLYAGPCASAASRIDESTTGRPALLFTTLGELRDDDEGGGGEEEVVKADDDEKNDAAAATGLFLENDCANTGGCEAALRRE
jgi:hypothetical protein